ncbi:MAG: hypothetical protein HC866_10485 [Leptolyngbyaceae cyanobacterium RU_5_1]|nr:hypothetical protein [Leptolyngbyaceae cyanobacterium RU_5_1]
MKHLLPVVIGFSGAIAVNSATLADEMNAAVPAGYNQNRLYTSEALTAPSVSVERTDDSLRQTNRSPYNKIKLNDVANSIQVKRPQSRNTGIPKDLIPKDLIRTPSRSSNLNPIEFFQVPPLDPSVGINIGRN